MLGAATYAAQFRPTASGTPGAPIVYEADGAVTITAPAGVVSAMLVGVHDVALRGVTVRAAAPQAVWIDNAARITLGRRHGDQQRRHRRAGQGGHVGDHHRLSARRQRARRA